MISTANISMQFGSKPLFENISISFSDNNRYGLIGANGSGKSTFMKILANELEQSSGTVTIDSSKRMAILKQDQFAFEDLKVTDCVIMGHPKLWEIKKDASSDTNCSTKGGTYTVRAIDSTHQR